MNKEQAFIQARNEANNMTFVDLNKRTGWIQRRTKSLMGGK